MQIFELFGEVLIHDSAATNSINNIDKKASGLGKVLGGLGKIALAAGAAIITGFGAALASGMKDAAEAESSIAQLDAVIKSTGGAAGMSREKLTGLADALEKTTKFSAESTQAAQALLLTFTNIGKDVFPMATETALDMATALGGDAASQSIALGKALNDPTKGITALSRVGVTFTEEQKNVIKKLQETGDMAGAQKVILAELGKEFGGSALAQGKTFAGQMEILKNAFGAVKEELATQFMPYLQKFMDFVVAHMPQIQAIFETGFKVVGNIVKVVADVFKDYLIPSFKSLYDWILPNIPKIKEIMKNAFDGIKDAVGVAVDIFDKLMEGLKVVGKWAMEHKELLINIGLVIGAFALSFKLVTGAIALWTTVTTIATAVTTAFGTAMAFLTSPVGLVVLAIGALIAIGVLLYKNWDEIKAWAGTVFPAIWESIKGAFAPVLDFFTGIFEGIKGIFAVVAIALVLPFFLAWEAIKAVWNLVEPFFSLIWEGIKAVFSVVKDVLLGFFTFAWEAIKAYIGLWVAVFQFVWDGIKLVFSVVKDVLLGFFTLAWNAIKAYIGLWVGVFQGVWNAISKVFSVVKDVLMGFFSSAWEAIKNVFEPVGKFFDGIWTIIKNTFTTIGSVIGDAIGGAFKVVVNSIINFAENTINGFIRAINGAIKLINKIPGVDIGLINTLSIPKLEKGTDYWEGGIANIHEIGGEIIDLPRGSRVIPHDVSMEMAKNSGGKGGITLTIDTFINNRKEDIEELAEELAFYMERKKLGGSH